MNEFWALVRNSSGLRHKHHHGSSRRWWQAYIALAWILAIGGIGYWIYRGTLTPYLLLNIMHALFFIGFAFAVGSIQQEWTGKTITWWLTLPYPRSKLLLAKLVASFIRFLRATAWAIAFYVLIAILGAILNPAVWNMEALGNVTETMIIVLLLVIIVSPLAMALGMLLALTLHAMKTLAPIMWALTITLLVFVINYINLFGVEANKGFEQLTSSSIALGTWPVLAFKVAVMLLLAGAVFGISSYMLAKHTEV